MVVSGGAHARLIIVVIMVVVGDGSIRGRGHHPRHDGGDARAHPHHRRHHHGRGDGGSTRGRPHHGHGGGDDALPHPRPHGQHWKPVLRSEARQPGRAYHP